MTFGSKAKDTYENYNTENWYVWSKQVIVVSEEFTKMFPFFSYYQIPSSRRKQFDDLYIATWGTGI